MPRVSFELQSVLASLEQIAHTDLASPAAVRQSALELEAMALTRWCETSLVATALRHARATNLTPALQGLYETYETNLEQNFAQLVICDSAPRCSGYPLYNRFSTLLQNEIRLIELTGKERVLFIGCGYFPISALLLAEMTDCTIDCCDLQSPAVSTSLEVIKSLDFDNISVVHAAGEQVNVSFYDAVFVAVLARPKDRILENIMHHAPKHCRILCRTSDGNRQLLYAPTQIRDYGVLSVRGHVLAENDQTISSLLLQF